MDTLQQQNGKNWRRYTLDEEGILFESFYNGKPAAREKLLYRELGFLKDHYQYSAVKESRFSQVTRRQFIIGGIVGAMVCFGISGALAGPDTKTTPATVAFIALGWAVLLTGSLVSLFTNKQVRYKTIHFRDDPTGLAFYARTQEDEDQIAVFSEEYQKAFTRYVKSLFEKDIAKAVEEKTLAQFTKQYTGWLEQLNESDVFSREEYLHYLGMINNATPKSKEK